uniref:mRNA decay activator protein ZFP36 n=1 Tax=Maylandia zebra TaxID=106582 RepID=A0A3P9CBC6_9CICH
MSEMLDDILTKNLINLALNEVSGQSHRSAPFFTPSPPGSLSLNMSTEHVNNDDTGSSLWPTIWGPAPVSTKKQLPFRPDRSMSLTESSFPPSSTVSAQTPPMVSSNRYKTELCRGFQETGSCKYGSKCQFAHGEAELRGLYRHPKYKTEPCRTFYNFGYCPYGSRCHFIHEEKISDGPLLSAKFQRQQTTTTPSVHNPRHQLRQSVSFAGFLGSSRSSSPPSFASVFSDPNQGFSRAPSVSPPPADLLSPVFDSVQREAAAFPFGSQQTRMSAGDIHNIPLILEPQVSRCVCGHGNNFSSNNSTAGTFVKPSLQRFSSEDSLEESYSSSSSSGTESPTFDGSATKRLTVFERLSLSD